MKIVFLDIDGVLNCTATYDRLRERNLPIHDDADWIEAELLARLDRICERTGALVVVHSSWRHKYNFRAERFNELFAKHKTKHIHVVDCTHGERWDGIAAWVYQQKGRVVAHVILDDMSPHEPLAAHVKTTEREGLTEEHVERAVAMLGVA